MEEKKSRILIADDEKDIRDILVILLKGEGFDVITAENGREAAELADETVDLYILDVNMPVKDGFSAAAEIREKYYAPMIFLTAYSGESDKVMGFSAGADDYIVKPFSNIELLMRVKAQLRRAGSYGPKMMGASAERAESDHIDIDDITLDLKSQSVVKDGRVIGLTHTEFRILELFASHRKKIYSIDNIYESIWEEEPVGDGAIMVHIKNIRKKLGDDSRNPRYIKTAWGKGYYID